MKKIILIAAGIHLMMVGAARANVLYLDHFDNDSLALNAAGIGGGAVNRTIQAHAWTDDGEVTFIANGTTNTQRALLYSENAFQSDTGFKLTVKYTTGSIEDEEAHNLSFGLISADTDCSAYAGFNPFRVDTSVYSIGANVTADGGTAFQGLNFTDGSIVTNLDQSGTRQQFVAGKSTEVTIEISYGGTWCYRINGEYEASGVLWEGFDLGSSYHVVVYGQDDNGGGKSIQSIKLESGYAAGERAASLRGCWNGGQGDIDNIKHLRTIDSTIARLNEGAIGSGTHNAPHKLLENIALGLTHVGGDPIAAPVPTWGDLSLDEPEEDPFLEEILSFRNAGIGAKVYSNSENFLGSNTTDLEAFSQRWKAYCDSDPEVQAFIHSQPYHTGTWNRVSQQYEDASGTYSNRPYMFCYAEYVLKEYSLRYGKYISSWTFDSADDMGKNGDIAKEGLLEEQRIFQAFANAVRAGNPEIPIAFNNGRRDNDEFEVVSSYPYVQATRFDDFTFGHAFNGNKDHASLAVNPDRNESIFDSNYRHISKMTEKNGYVHDGGEWDWDDLIVGNFHSKLGPVSWQYSTPSAWTQEEFNQWNLEAMQAGGHTTWEGSVDRTNRILRDWAITLLEGLDDHLAQYQNPGPPSWARKYTVLPEATVGQAYHHVLVEGEDFWDPENEDITSVVPIGNAPSWLMIQEDPADSTQWILSGIPTEPDATTLEFALEATEVNGLSGSREVELVVNERPPVQTTVAILADATTDYGTGTVATMISEVLTAPDGLATFQIAIDVVPMSGTSIRSGDGGGSTTVNSWGIFSEGETSSHTQIFNGNAGESVEGISNLRVINFNANGSRLSPANITGLSFKSVTIADSQSSNDRVVIVANGVINNPGGTQQATNPFVFDLETLAGSTAVSNFSLAVGNASSTDKWAVNSIQVNYTAIPASGNSYSTWASDYGLTGENALPGADVENGGIGDGYDNLAEFALGMNPTNSDAGSRESVGFAVDAGTNWFDYVHYRRSDYAAQGLSYLLIDSTNLVDSASNTNAQDQLLVGPVVDGYEPVTNRYSTDDPVKYIKLDIQQN